MLRILLTTCVLVVACAHGWTAQWAGEVAPGFDASVALAVPDVVVPDADGRVAWRVPGVILHAVCNDSAAGMEVALWLARADVRWRFAWRDTVTNATMCSGDSATACTVADSAGPFVCNASSTTSFMPVVLDLTCACLPTTTPNSTWTLWWSPVYARRALLRVLFETPALWTINATDGSAIGLVPTALADRDALVRDAMTRAAQATVAARDVPVTGATHAVRWSRATSVVPFASTTAPTARIIVEWSFAAFVAAIALLGVFVAGTILVRCIRARRARQRAFEYSETKNGAYVLEGDQSDVDDDVASVVAVDNEPPPARHRLNQHVNAMIKEDELL